VTAGVRMPAYVYHNIWRKYHGPGPWPCAECKKLVVKIGRRSNEGHVHHKDEDRFNNAIENLEIMHGICHIRHHKLGTHLSAEHKAKIGASSLGRPLSYEARQKVSAAQLGRPKSQETKMKLRQHQLASRLSCDKCGFVTTKSHMRRHKCRSAI
jgi:hypothetical protein